MRGISDGDQDSFEVRHRQPVTVEKLLELDLGTLTNEMSRLGYSIERLIQSNEELLESEVDPECDLESRVAFKQAREENLVTIESQKERIQMIQYVIGRKTRRPGSITRSNARTDSSSFTVAQNHYSDHLTKTASSQNDQSDETVINVDSNNGLSL